MEKKKTDRHLDIPSEANRDKHINFVALENEEQDPADQQDSGNLSGDEKDKAKADDKKKEQGQHNT